MRHAQEIKKVEHRVQEFEQERLQQRMQYESVVAERDILGTQLVRRNDELALQYQRVKIQYNTLQNGEVGTLRNIIRSVYQ